MPRLSAAPITLTPEQEADLRGLARAHKTPRKLAERAEMILRSAAIHQTESPLPAMGCVTVS